MSGCPSRCLVPCTKALWTLTLHRAPGPEALERPKKNPIVRSALCIAMTSDCTALRVGDQQTLLDPCGKKKEGLEGKALSKIVYPARSSNSGKTNLAAVV
jgi:hypothetical protein